MNSKEPPSGAALCVSASFLFCSQPRHLFVDLFCWGRQYSGDEVCYAIVRSELMAASISYDNGNHFGPFRTDKYRGWWIRTTWNYPR